MTMTLKTAVETINSVNTNMMVVNERRQIVLEFGRSSPLKKLFFGGIDAIELRNTLEANGGLIYYAPEHGNITVILSADGSLEDLQKLRKAGLKFEWPAMDKTPGSSVDEHIVSGSVLEECTHIVS